MVQQGNLSGAGVELLAIVPRVTLAGRVVIQTLQNKGDLSMKAMRTETAYLELLSSLGSCDIVIGQGLAGRLGSITVAQIQVLEELRSADQEFKELFKALPEDFEG